MGSPSSSLATLRPDLGGFEEFDLEADRRGFIAHRIYPVLEVGLAGDAIPKVTLESLLRNVDTTRAPRAAYGRDNWEFTTDSYATVEHGWEEPIDDGEARKYRHYFDFEQVAASRCMDAVLRHMERRVAAAVFNATTFASYTTAVTNEWDDLTNADPVEDIETAKESVWSQCGLDANALIISKPVFNNLRRCENVIDKIHSEGAGQSILQGRVNVALLAQAFDLDYVLVAGGTENIANRGQDMSLTRIWSDEFAMICKVATTQDMREPCIGRTFHWDEDGSSIMGTYETYRDEIRRSDVVRARNQTDEKMLYVQAGHLLSNITTVSDGGS